jgi:Tol biopolymer transport system component
MIMKKLLLFYLVIGLPVMSAGQDMFSARQLTFDPAQNGFATWAPDGKSIVFQRTDMSDTLGKNGLWEIAPDGTGLKQIFSGLAEHPRWSPDNRYIVFDADTGASIGMIPVRGGDLVKFLPDSVTIRNGGMPCWSPDGSQVAFLERKGESLCIYDPGTHELKSLFREDGKLPLPGGWWNDGKSILVALMDRQTRKSTIERISVDGKEKTQIPCPHENFYRYLALSPDGSLLVFGAVNGRYVGLYVMSSDGGPFLPLAVTENNHNEGAAWSPDGRHIAFTSTRSGNFDIWIMDVDIDEIKEKLQVKPPAGLAPGTVALR